jgi:hemoglobin
VETGLEQRLAHGRRGDRDAEALELADDPLVSQPDRFTRELGFHHVIDMHRHLKITDEQRERFVALYMEALDEAGLPNDEPFQRAVCSHLEFGSRVAQQNSWAETDADLHPIRTVPRWQWPAASS